MRKKLVFSLAVAASLLATGCRMDSNRADAEDEGMHIVEHHRETMLYAMLLEAKGTDSIRVLTDLGDSLWMTVPDPEAIVGELIGNDRLAIMPMQTNPHVVNRLVNLTQMMGRWIEPSPLDEGSGQGVQLLEGGTAVSINSQTTEYESWRFADGRLVLVSHPIGFEDTEQMVDTFDVVLLSRDSLQLANASTRFFFTHTLGKPETDLTGVRIGGTVREERVNDDYDLFNPEGDVAPAGQENEDGLMY